MNKTKPRLGRVAQDVNVVVTLALAAYGTYTIARIGYEWAKIGFVAIKNRKEINI